MGQKSTFSVLGACFSSFAVYREHAFGMCPIVCLTRLARPPQVDRRGILRALSLLLPADYSVELQQEIQQLLHVDVSEVHPRATLILLSRKSVRQLRTFSPDLRSRVGVFDGRYRAISIRESLGQI